MEKKTVAAVVVTYNRKRLLIECLDALLSQSRPIDKIFIIDNASTDGTYQLLSERGYLNWSEVEYVRLPENTGGAGGFYEGIKLAYEGGFDWIWIMDDDAEPLRDAFDKMYSYLVSDFAAVANLKVDEDGVPQYHHLGWFEFKRIEGRFIRVITPENIKSSSLEIDFSSFVGLAISRSAIAKIGLPKKEFFIHHDDIEYCARLQGVGEILLITASIIKHKDGAKKEVNTTTSWFFGRKSERVKVISLERRYYGIRNGIWLRKHYGSIFCALIYSFSFLTRTLIGIICYDDRKWIRIRFYVNAVRDGLLGKFDNQRPKQLLGRI